MSETNTIIMAKGERTCLIRASAGSHSLRTTVPKGIASHFDLRPGDSILWSIAPAPDRKGLMIVLIPDKVRRA